MLKEAKWAGTEAGFKRKSGWLRNHGGLASLNRMEFCVPFVCGSLSTKVLGTHSAPMAWLRWLIFKNWRVGGETINGDSG